MMNKLLIDGGSVIISPCCVTAWRKLTRQLAGERASLATAIFITRQPGVLHSYPCAKYIRYYAECGPEVKTIGSGKARSITAHGRPRLSVPVLPTLFQYLQPTTFRTSIATAPARPPGLSRTNPSRAQELPSLPTVHRPRSPPPTNQRRQPAAHSIRRDVTSTVPTSACRR